MFNWKNKDKSENAQIDADFKDLAKMRGFKHLKKKLEDRRIMALGNLRASGKTEHELAQNTGCLLEIEFLIASLKEFESL